LSAAKSGYGNPASRTAPDFTSFNPGYAGSFYFGYFRDRLFRIETDRFGPFDQLDQGDALLSYFYVADIGLGAAQPLGEIDLAQAGNLAVFDQERPQGFVTPGVQGPKHSASRIVTESKAECSEFAPRYIAQNESSGTHARLLRHRAAMSELSHTRQNSQRRGLTACATLFKIDDGGSRKGSKGNAVRVLEKHVMPRLPPQL
jgi:hypothetical protein